MAAREVDKVGEDEASHDNVWSAGSDVVDTGQRRSCDKDGFAMVKIWRGECYTLKEERSMCIVRSAISAYPIRASTPMATSPLPIPLNVTNTHHAIANPFVPESSGLWIIWLCAIPTVSLKLSRMLELDPITLVVALVMVMMRLGAVELLTRLLPKFLGQSQLLFVTGTHAITCALFALLRTGDELLAVAGAPYDTLEEVLGKRESGGLGSLQDFGVKYREVPLAEDGGLDWNALMSAVKPKTKCALIQRSCGYSWRRSLSVNEIGRAIKIIKKQKPSCSVMVDNCYGEFVESIEPPMVGADLIAGSLIKNPGGTIAPCGGYIAGKKKCVEAAAARLSAPGLGVDCGSTPGDIMRAFFQGLFLSSQMVGEAIKAIQLGSHERLLAFCEAVQRSSPVGSYTKPVAGATPGYASEVIFADGTFIDGSTSELSCDGPLREPFTVFCQGGTHWTQWGLVL
ncbi:hypothetical protein GmHk_06G017421 [Glycine max]|nr:hypothetical protein GmHk_06G017421 [Glycine max]